MQIIWLFMFNNEPWLDADRHYQRERENSINNAIKEIDRLYEKIEELTEQTDELQGEIYLCQKKIEELEDYING